MASRTVTAIVVASMLTWQLTPIAAHAENAMGYRLLSVEDAASLPRNRGALGMQVERARQITDSGMSFDLIRIKQVRPGSPGAQAGLHAGDQIIAVNGKVFPSIAAFSAYVGSMSPGRRVSIDYIRAGGGPANAERVSATIAAAGTSAANAPQYRRSDEPAQPGMSSRAKIGLGAAALLGCYAMGCFSSKSTASGSSNPSYAQQPYGSSAR
jgi:hypothetical protein